MGGIARFAKGGSEAAASVSSAASDRGRGDMGLESSVALNGTVLAGLQEKELEGIEVADQEGYTSAFTHKLRRTPYVNRLGVTIGVRYKLDEAKLRWFFGTW